MFSYDFNDYLPMLIVILKAIGIGLVGFGIAILLKKFIVNVLTKVEFLKNEEKFLISLGKLVYYFVLLITMIALLEVLGLKYITQPFIDLINQVMVYIPNIIGAGIILFLGILFSKIAKEFVKSLLTTLQVDEFGKKYKIDNISTVVANIVYLVLVLLVILASLNTLQITIITQPATEMIASILLTLPKIIAAALVFGIIFFIGKFFAEIVANIADDLEIDELAKEAGISSQRLKFRELVKYVIMTFVVLIGLSQAFDYIDAKALYTLTQNFIEILFKVIIASVIIFAGAYLGTQLQKRLDNRNLGIFIKTALIILSVILSLPYLGIAPNVVYSLVFAISIGVGLAFALAFGLGGKDVAKEILEDILRKNKKLNSENKEN